MKKMEDKDIKQLKKGSTKMENKWKVIKWKNKRKKYHLQFNRCSNIIQKLGEL